MQARIWTLTKVPSSVGAIKGSFRQYTSGWYLCFDGAFVVDPILACMYSRRAMRCIQVPTATCARPADIRPYSTTGALHGVGVAEVMTTNPSDVLYRFDR